MISESSVEAEEDLGSRWDIRKNFAGCLKQQHAKWYKKIVKKTRNVLLKQFNEVTPQCVSSKKPKTIESEPVESVALRNQCGWYALVQMWSPGAPPQFLYWSVVHLQSFPSQILLLSCVQMKAWAE
jgi:hypothetical protein